MSTKIDSTFSIFQNGIQNPTSLIRNFKTKWLMRSLTDETDSFISQIIEPIFSEVLYFSYLFHFKFWEELEICQKHFKYYLK